MRATERATGATRAVKIISKARFSAAQFDAFRNEYAIIKSISHPNIVKAHDYFEDSEHIYLVMDFLGGGELFDRIAARRHYSEKDASVIMRQLCEGLKYLHERKIVHCDLKPDNFLFELPDRDVPIKIIDFGMSKYCKHKQFFHQLAGTSFYIAPEVLSGEYRESCDMWSFGVVLFVMIYGFPPFHGNTDDEIFKAVRKGFEPRERAGYGAFFPADMKRSESVRDLVSRLLTTDPAARLTAAEALQHPWLRGETATADGMLGNIFQNMSQMASKAKLRRALLDSMTTKMHSTDIETVKKAFRSADKNGDGTLSVEEFQAALKSCGVDAKMDADAVLKAVDVDGDGKISYNELLLATAHSKLLATEERMWREFCRLDINRDGKISAAEIEKALGPQHGRQAAEMIKEIDKNGDGTIDYDEFLSMWMNKEQAEQLAASRTA